MVLQWLQRLVGAWATAANGVERAEDERLGAHENGYKRLMLGLREGVFDHEGAQRIDILQARTLDAVLNDEEARHG